MLGPYRAWPVGGTFHRGLSLAAHAAAEWNAVQDPSCKSTKPISCAERVQYSGSGCELAFVRAACGTPFAPSLDTHVSSSVNTTRALTWKKPGNSPHLIAIEGTPSPHLLYHTLIYKYSSTFTICIPPGRYLGSCAHFKAFLRFNLSVS